MAWMVEFTVEPRYMPSISLPPENRAYAFDISKRKRYEPLAYDPGLMPERVFYTSGGKTIPDFVPISAQFSVCQEVRDLVEALEPGVHQFLPEEVVRPRTSRPIHRLDGRVLDTPYYIFNIMSILDAIWVARSHVRLHEVQGLAPLVHPEWLRFENGAVVYEVVLRREITQGHHVWRGGRHSQGSIFFSDAMMEAIRRLKLKKLNAYHMEEA